MKKYVKAAGLLIFMVFSFYYTEKVALYVQNQTPLKKEIITFKEKGNIDYINATIEGNYIIPGINGLEINVNKSYNNMKSYNVFNESKLVYDEVSPNIKLNDYPNKVIISGNKTKNAISILVNNKNNILDKYNIIYNSVNDIPYCAYLVNNCSNNQKIFTTNINNENIYNYLKNIKRGDIIYLSDDLKEDNIILLLNKIKFYNLNIMSITNHLSEHNSNLHL